MWVGGPLKEVIVLLFISEFFDLNFSRVANLPIPHEEKAFVNICFEAYEIFVSRVT